jgi:cytochrome b6-f complex iron-sulfur subunit
MDPWVIIVIGVGGALAAVAIFAAARRQQTGEATGQMSRETVKRDKRGRKEFEAESERRVTGRAWERTMVLERRSPPTDVVVAGDTAPVTWTPPDADAVGVTRRQFFNRSVVALMGFSLAVFGAQVIAFLWPQSKGGFGSTIRVGPVPDIKADIAAADGFLYVPEGKMWVTEYPAGALEKAQATYSPPELAGMEVGLVALFQKCPHLGCRVPSCLTSQWFECPCHGSRYNQVGEKRGGPAPRGMDRFAMSVEGGNFIVNTGIIIQGPPIGTNTTGQEPEGPSCLGAGSH